MIVVTGAAGFIGSCLVRKLNQAGLEDIVLVDDFSRQDKIPNLQHALFSLQVERDRFSEWLKTNKEQVTFIYHLGARTDTTLFDIEVFNELNLNYSKTIWQACVRHQIPLVYASSAATYGDGAHGYQDEHWKIPRLSPLNPYGQSKQDFDLWAITQIDTPPFWIGLKFFNVFGPNEYHKGRMASVVLHCYRQIMETGEMQLFQSHHPDFKDGEQQRDFIYVGDVIDVLHHFYAERQGLGIYNLGSGKARTFIDLVTAVFSALEKPVKISFIPTPEDIRDNYQYFTEASMEKLRRHGYKKEFTSLESAVQTYVKEFLKAHKYF